MPGRPPRPLAAEAPGWVPNRQRLLMRRAREQEDYTTEKTDAKDSVLTARPHCYLPERVAEDWGLLRAAGTTGDGYARR